MRTRVSLAVVVAIVLAAAGCGGGDDGAGGTSSEPEPARTPFSPSSSGEQAPQADEEEAAASLGFPGFATKNTTRVGGADPVANAAAAALAVFSAQSPITRPTAVTLVDRADYRGGLAAAVLMSAPLRAPILLSDGDDIPDATQEALDQLRPKGAREAGGAQVIRVGDVPRPEGYKTTDIEGVDAPALARAIDRFQSAATGKTTEAVVVVSADEPAFAMPAAAWAAKAGDPVMFVSRDAIPAATRTAIQAHQRPDIYVLGPERAIGAEVFGQLRRLGTVTRVQGPDPVANAIAFARFADGPFGWGVQDPGHGLVFANAQRPVDAVAAAPLSSSGTYGPLLLLDQPTRVPRALEEYLLDIQPGYESDPVRGVYNHGWVIGDEEALSAGAQSRIDSLLEIVPVKEG